MPPPLPPPLRTLTRTLTRHPPRLRPLVHARHYALRERPVVVPASLSNSKKRLMNEQIPAETVNYVDASGIFHEGVRTQQILVHLDRARYNLECLTDPYAEVVVCKVLPKEKVVKALEHDKEKYQQEKLKRKEKKEKWGALSTVKELELSWAISEHDLEHRLKKISQFLRKGFKVEITLGVRKGMAKQMLVDMKALLERVREECEESGKEVAEPEGDIGRRYTMVFQGYRSRKDGKREAIEGQPGDGHLEEGQLRDRGEVMQPEGERI